MAIVVRTDNRSVVLVAEVWPHSGLSIADVSHNRIDYIEKQGVTIAYYLGVGDVKSYCFSSATGEGHIFSTRELYGNQAIRGDSAVCEHLLLEYLARSCSNQNVCPVFAANGLQARLQGCKVSLLVNGLRGLFVE